MTESNKFGISEKVGCFFLWAGLIFLVVFHLILPGLVLNTLLLGFIVYIDLLSYLFLIIALVYLKTYSKKFIYTLFVVFADLIVTLVSLLFFNYETQTGIWVTYFSRLLDFSILFLICAAVNQYACQVKNSDLGEKCLYVFKLIIWMAVIVVIYNLRFNIPKLIAMEFLAAVFTIFSAGIIPLAFIMLPIFMIFQISGLIKEFKESLRLRSYIDFK